MKATYIPTKNPCPETIGVAPEILAACLARYSRSKDGIDAILAESAGKSPDAIFKFIDYGHASIGGLTGGIAIAVDGVSMLLAYKLFEFAQMADGQESSTRYIQFDRSGIPNPDEIGIPKHLQSTWQKTLEAGLNLYHGARITLENKIANNPEAARLPAAALQKEQVKARMLKNYALDRSRYFLPFACKTSLAIVATARIWADTLKQLESLQWPEAISAAALIRTELSKVSPNLIRHSHPDNASVASAWGLLQNGQFELATTYEFLGGIEPCQCRLAVLGEPSQFNNLRTDMKSVFRGKSNRYSHVGAAIKRQTVQAEWSAVAIAELRDLNRHRTGYRFSDFLPQGFYFPQETADALAECGQVAALTEYLMGYSTLVRELARQGAPGIHAYGFALGTQVAFEHTQQADKFLYEVELRTGLGAHFRYAEHLKQAAELYFEKFPETRGFVQIGTAEPE